MAKSTEKDPRWADLSRRLADNPELAAVLDDLTKEIDAAPIENEHRSRLKAPYSNATPIGAGADEGWR